MIKEIPFQYDLVNVVVDLKFQSEFSKILKHYDFLTIAEEAEAVKILLMACFEDARRSRARTISYRWAVIDTSETHHGDIKAVSFKEKNHGNSSKSGNKTLSVSRAESDLCQLCGKNNHSNADYRTRTSEFTNNQNRPYVISEALGGLVKATGDRDWIPNFKELIKLKRSV